MNEILIDFSSLTLSRLTLFPPVSRFPALTAASHTSAVCGCSLFIAHQTQPPSAVRHIALPCKGDMHIEVRPSEYGGDMVAPGMPQLCGLMLKWVSIL